MKTPLAGAVLATSLASVVPAAAQRIDIGPDGPRVDLRSRAQRERDVRREEHRRDRADDEDRLYRRQRYGDPPVVRRGYGYLFGPPTASPTTAKDRGAGIRRPVFTWQMLSRAPAHRRPGDFALAAKRIAD